MLSNSSAGKLTMNLAQRSSSVCSNVSEANEDCCRGRSEWVG